MAACLPTNMAGVVNSKFCFFIKLSLQQGNKFSECLKHVPSRVYAFKAQTLSIFGRKLAVTLGNSRRFNVTPLLLYGGQLSVCWRCSKRLTAEKFFCDECQAIQKPRNDVDYFKLFNLQHMFDVDDRELANKFKNMQKLLHPDKFSIKSLEEMAIAEEYSSLVNKAYSVLKQPWSRGVYLLKTVGVDAEEETTVDDPELLVIVMERNEAVALAKDASVLIEIDKENKKDMAVVLAALSETFRLNELESAKQLVHKLKYLSNIDEKLNEKKLKFGITE